MKGLILLAAVIGGIILAGLVLNGTAGANGTTTITVKQSNVEPGGRGCVDGEWHLVINQIERPSLAPSSVDVTFSDGHTHTKSLSKFTGKVAHYSIFDHLTDTLVTATADIYDDWPGQFVVSHSPCVTPTPTPTPTVTPTPTPVCEEEPCNTPTPTPTPSVTPTATPEPTPAPTTTPTPTASTSTSETPLSLPNTGGEPSDSGGIPWWAALAILGGASAAMAGLVLLLGPAWRNK